MFFGYFLMLVAVTIAGVSAYFSVYGLAHIFAATFWSVVIMGGVLEVGKLVATSFLYRYWDAIGWYLRTYLLIAILGLMAITSAGIFGYLSNAYQQDTVGVKDVVARIELLDVELASLSERDKQINLDIDRIGSNFVTARQNMIKQYGPEKNKITERIANIRTEKLELSTKQLEVEAHTGPIIYIAKAMDKGIDEAVMWMIILIIVVFDPLAVALTIGANLVLAKRTARRPINQPSAYLNPNALEKAASENNMYGEDGKIRWDCRLCGEVYRRIEDADQCEGTHMVDPIVEETSSNITEHNLAEQVTTLTNINSDLHTTLDLIRRRVDDPNATIPEGMQLVVTEQYQAIRAAVAQAADDLESLESDLSHKQEMIDTLSNDNQRLEDEVFALAEAFMKKETQIAQLKDAIRALEEQQE